MENRTVKNQTRPRTRRSSSPPPQDAILSVLLIQAAICVVVVGLAYGLKASGLPFYEAARGTLETMLHQEGDLRLFHQAAQRWGWEIPAWLTGTQDLKPQEAAPQDFGVEPQASSQEENAPSQQGNQSFGSEGRPEMQEEAAQQQNSAGTKEESPLFDEELQGYIEQYLPQEAVAEPDPASAPLPPLQEKPQEGIGGGVNPVRLVGKTERLSPPQGTTVSPFFLTMDPILPVDYGILTCRFGYRIHPITGKPDFHTGVDIGAAEGAAISAVLPGTVSEVGESSIYGNYVVVRHASGLETMYCHCSQVLVPEGTVVRQREVIARVGSTGLSTGNHVHLEFHVGGLKADPAWVYDEF